ncbi:discoidin domain-containing protein [Actinokineospora sp.]|uniref:discoidin domain-containing protein n=1 Tax=Actinokineospora sp. TaxID=1872133 RepID=UPI003D6BAC1E
MLGAAVLAMMTLVTAYDWDGPTDHGSHRHVTPGPDIVPAAADPTLSRAGWTAAADSAHGGYPASNVLDGNNDTIWHTPYGTGATALPHTITLDMKASNVVSALRYQPRLGTNRGGTIGGYQIHVSADGANWGNAVSAGTLNDDAFEKAIPFRPTIGRYIRLTAVTEAGNRGPWSTAAEINVNGIPAPTLPRTGWTAAADSAHAGYPASNVLDGNNDTIWHTPYGTGATALPHTITLDMKASNVVTGLRYQPRLGTNRGGTIGGYQIHVSTDGATWGTAVATGTMADSAAEKSIPFAPKTGRYVRLTATTEAGNRGPWSTAAELNIVGAPAPTLDRTGWTVKADSQETRAPNNQASNVLDGDNNTLWSTRYLGTVAPLPHYITIDMKKSQAVSGLRYQPRLGALRNGTIGSYQVRVSADGVTWGNPVASGVWADNEAEKTATFPPTTGRYVRLTALSEAGNRGQWSSAAELNLTGTPATLNPKTYGSWGSTIGFPMVPVAVSQLPNGKILAWSASDPLISGGSGLTHTAMMDPATGAVTPRVVNETQHDMFCPGTATLPDGKLMITGGQDSTKTTIYNPADNTWSAGTPMVIPRGYQSSVTLSDGRVFTIGGSWAGAEGGKDGEVWSPTEGARHLPNVPVSSILTADPEGVYRSDNHPWLFAASNGRVFHAGPSKQMNWFSIDGPGARSDAGLRSDDRDAMNGDAVMYDIGKIFTSGGSPAYANSTASNRTFMIDIRSGATPTVTNGAPMAFKRAFHNSVVLPDGKVIVTGGQSYAAPYSDAGAIMPAEVWDPATNTFTTLASMTVPRNYHSVASLLPDGRVFTAGGGLCGSCGTNHPDAQVFSPPYLFNPDGTPATRPTIVSAGAAVNAGETLAVSTDVAVSSFSLVRMGTVTHNVNTDQRRVPLTVASSTGTAYTLSIPADRGVVIPGYYMLFAMDANGVPSVSKAVQVI